MSRRKPARTRQPPGTGRPAHDPDPADVQAVRAALKRATRRLNVLELIILCAAAIAALAGGWLAAFLAARAFDLAFGTTWVVASLALFLIPALAAFLVDRRRKAQAPGASHKSVQSPERDSE